MVTEFVSGQSQEFIANITFSLNWDDRDIKSIKIREGQVISYDGEIATINNGAGSVRGRCMGLKSAINVMGWLSPAEDTEVSEVPEIVSESLFKDEDYDPRIGGNLDTHFERNNMTGKREIIREDDLIVKKIPPINQKEEPVKKGKLEIAGDQVEVPKERLLVSSSTIRVRTEKRNVKIVKADEMGADSVLPLKGLKKAATTPNKKAFTVDDTTPRQIHEDMTRDEVQRITKVIIADESQDAKVVKKIDSSKMEVKEVEGITLRKTTSPKDIQFNKTTTPSGMTIKTTVGSGSNYSAGDQGGVVVGRSKAAKKGIEKSGKDLINDIFEEAPELTEEEKKEAAAKLVERTKKAKARAANRKKSSKETQKLMEKDKKPSKVSTDKPPEMVQEIKLNEDVTKITSSDATTDYLLILPDNWNKLHWVKKEKFIKELDDVHFIRFILSMESTKAVRNACNERLEELGQKESG